MNGPVPDSAAEAREPVLACTDVTKSFGGNGEPLSILRGVSLSVCRGDIVAIRGRTGVGKTTLLLILAGLDRPTSGSVAVDGQPLDGLPGAALARLRRERLGIIFQNFNLLPSWTALENVEAAMLHTGIAKAARRERARALLGQLGLGDRLAHLPAALSAGQQQLVTVARALANQPAVILADEPTGDVDRETGQGIAERLASLARDQGAAIVVATHGHFPPTIANRLFRLADGRLEPVPAQSVTHDV